MSRTCFVAMLAASVGLCNFSPACGVDFGENAAPEPALAIAHTDSGLAWGPCPDFMPAGCAIAVLHGEPGAPNADVFLKVPAGARIPAHWHSSAERMVLVAGELRLAYEGQPLTVLRAGDYAYGPAYRVHEARCTTDDACVLFIAFESAVDAVAGDAIDPFLIAGQVPPDQSTDCTR